MHRRSNACSTSNALEFLQTSRAAHHQVHLVVTELNPTSVPQDFQEQLQSANAFAIPQALARYKVTETPPIDHVFAPLVALVSEFAQPLLDLGSAHGYDIVHPRPINMTHMQVLLEACEH